MQPGGESDGPHPCQGHGHGVDAGLPRPGPWMDKLRQGFAFPMYATAAWLVWVLAQQAGVNAVAVALAGMGAIAFAAWLHNSFRSENRWAKWSGTALASVALAAAFVGGYLGVQAGSPAQLASATEGHAWEPYSAQRLQDLRAQGEPVFVNLTAAWCITCLVNERVALGEASVASAFKAANITYLKGDWTQQDPHITQLLAQFGRSGVPLYAFYPKGASAKPLVLPQILTPDIVLSAIKQVTSPSP
ncbi:MAG: hypothetical protein EOP38_14995 [Rubrivivax sp.]|nr:MAG: hypothetical protein EOP38_14995 [Rubrivivax sp.]